jgi:uncharacterized protein YutE (UPF0331/DUF86 family)
MNHFAIEKRIKHIEKKFETLKLAIIDFEKEQKKFEKYKALKTIERDCEEIVESAVRINQEVLESVDFFPETYRKSFEELSRFELFPEKELEKLAGTTGFRNRLSHEYLDLDERITLKSAKNILKLYPKYLAKISEFVFKN